MKFFIFISAALLFCCSPSYGAMEALSNESLSKVKGSDGYTASRDSLPEEQEEALKKEKDSATDDAELSVHCRLKSLHESNEYKKFNFYLMKMEQFSNALDYPYLARSDQFVFFSSCFTETAKTCYEKLAQLTALDHGDGLSTMVNEKNIIFCKADDFHTNLLRYKKGTAPLPNLKALISDIKACQRNFEALFENINGKL